MIREAKPEPRFVLKTKSLLESQGRKVYNELLNKLKHKRKHEKNALA